MSSTFSEHWYRVAALHPRLRSHVVSERHCYRDEIWHVLKDPLSGRQHRLNDVGYAIVARCDGRLSMQQIWELVVAEKGDDAPTQPDMLALLAQLHDGELIQTEASPDLAGLFEQRSRRQQREQRQRLNPLSMRISLFDPTPLLEALAPFGALFLKRWAAVAWLLLIGTALAFAIGQMPMLRAYGARHLTSPQMLLVLWLAYPVIKALHEFGHAMAVKVWGGEVRETGVALLLLMPVPYVNASDASGFRERRRRVLVSLMGIIVETALASAALFVWMNVADGVVRQVAFATMLIGGVSTLVFNGNPLMRFDAYFALADLIESPGLAARSRAWWLYFFRKHVFQVAQAVPPAVAARERRWLIGYGFASQAYRVVVAFAIVGWLVGVHALLGAAAAAWFVVLAIGHPLLKLYQYVAGSPELAGRRTRAAVLAGVAVAGTALALVGLPLPQSTRAEGVVWVPEQAHIRTLGEGFIAEVRVADGQQVRVGDTLMLIHDPLLDTELQRIEARLGGLDVAYHLALFSQRSQANSVEQEIVRARAELARVEKRMVGLAVRSDTNGRVALDHAQDMPGTFVARGALVGHVLANDAAHVRVVVSQDDVARLQQHPGPIEVRLAELPETPFAARLVAQTPAAIRSLPSAALGDRAGGQVATDPTDAEGLRTLEPLYTLDLEVPTHALERVGGRAEVRFDHGSAPLAQQWGRKLRQLFIGPLVITPTFAMQTASAQTAAVQTAAR